MGFGFWIMDIGYMVGMVIYNDPAISGFSYQAKLWYYNTAAAALL